MPRLAAPLAGVLLAAGLAACGGGSAAGGAAAGTPVATTTVDLPRSYRFEPAAIRVVAGATVTWTNSDNFTHSVELEGEAAPGLVMHPGQSVSRTFAAPGRYAYVCAFHPQEMRGVVEVTSASGTEQP